MAAPSFIFGGNTGVQTPQELERKRQLVDALMGRSLAGYQAPRNVGEAIGQGLSGIGDALMLKGWSNKLNQQEAAGRKSASDAFAPIVSALAGGGSASPNASVSTAPASSGGDYYASLAHTESGGNDAAKNPLSSATGRYQFTTGTWDSLMHSHPELGLTPNGRMDPGQQDKAIRAFTADNATALGNAGIEATPGNLYAAHFLGAGGATNVLAANDADPLSAHVAPEVIKANPSLAGMSVGQFKQWAAGKVGGAAPEVASNDVMMPPHPSAPTPGSAYASGYAASVPSPGFGATMTGQMAPASAIDQPTVGNLPTVVAKGPRIAAETTGAISPRASSTMTPFMPLATTGMDAQPSVGPQASPQSPVMAALAQRFGNSQQLANADPRKGILQALLAQGGVAAPAQPQPGFPAAPGAQMQQSGPTTAQLASALSNPWLSDGQKAVAMALLKQRMSANDPSTQLAMQYKRAQIEHLLNPQAKAPSFGQSPIILTDPDGKMHMGQMSSGGGMLIDGKTYASLPEKWKVGTVSQSGSGGLSPETLDILATQYLAGDKSAIQGFSRNANMRAQLANAIAKKADEMGMDGKAIAAEISAYGGNVAAQRAAGTRSAQVGMAASEANQMADVALEASQAVPRGKFVPWNAAVNAYRTGTSSPEMAAFVTATTSLVNAYARAVSPLGAPTDAMRKHAEMMLSTAQSPEAYKAVIDQMKKEMVAALNAPAEVSGQLKEQITGKKSETQSPATPATHSGPPEPGSVEDGYRFKGGDPADQNNWEKVQ